MYQYDGIIIPGLFIGAVYGLKFFLDRWPKKETALKYVLAATVLISFFMRSPVSPIHFPWALFGSRPRCVAFRQMLKVVPPGVSVAAHAPERRERATGPTYRAAHDCAGPHKQASKAHSSGC